MKPMNLEQQCRYSEQHLAAATRPERPILEHQRKNIDRNPEQQKPGFSSKNSQRRH
jgi:hypothetical protein